jgi:spore photoproduct lyase
VKTGRTTSAMLFRASSSPLALPSDYQPVRPMYFEVENIVLAKGSVSTSERRRFVERICALYPQAKIADCTGMSHNRLDLGLSQPLARHEAGKRTLVFGELADSVRFSKEAGNSCPNYWHFSPYGFCPYGCAYCYLAGTRGVWYSPTVKIYVNAPEILLQIGRLAGKMERPTAFYLGKLQDGLALDPLTAYSTMLVSWFARQPVARQVILTKSDSVERLLDLDHAGNTILSWSLNPPGIAAMFERNVPPVAARIKAMRRCAERGYPVRAVVMPIIPVDDWKVIYALFLERLLTEIPLQRVTFGGICSYKGARTLMEEKLGGENTISAHIDPREECGDGRARFSGKLRREIYAHMLACVRRIRPNLVVALCLEDSVLWKDLGIEGNLGQCNCVL